ncbi:hypothetical protein MUK42_34790 [Musa troglodytarum]|uniref:Uncharacterized protein n=1 Tax=Musa troglodytarum TaxID=320322 RepID=A0A9E7GA06_9LILI|nr:hypothetical protein MUK42_34790 [Musa troglodytarum]
MRTGHLPCPLAPLRNHRSVQDSPSPLGRDSFASTSELPTSRFCCRRRIAQACENPLLSSRSGVAVKLPRLEIETDWPMTLLPRLRPRDDRDSD